MKDSLIFCMAAALSVTSFAERPYAFREHLGCVHERDIVDRCAKPADELKLELDGLRIAYGLFMEGAATLRRAAEGLSGSRRENALKVAGLGEYMGRTCRTAVNVKAATAEEDVVLSKTAAESEKAAARSRILALARDEYENAKATLPLVDADSRLGWEPTMGYCGGREQIEWKLRRNFMRWTRSISKPT